jgi:hypothetical protein
MEGHTDLTVLQTPVVLLPGYSGILEDRMWPVKQHHNHHDKMETNLYHLAVWCIQGKMLITTKISSVKLLILRGDKQLNLQKSLYIYNVSSIPCDAALLVTFCPPICHCIQAAGRLESVVQLNACVPPSIISTILLLPAGVIVTVVTGAVLYIIIIMLYDSI